MNRNPRFAIAWSALLASVFAGMGFAAFHPFERFPSNDAVFDADARSLRFGSRGKTGFATLDGTLRPNSSEIPALTVALWLRTAPLPAPRSQAILTIDDGRSPAVLRLGQTASTIRLTWREKRRNRIGRRYLGSGRVFRPATEQFVAIVTDESGTRMSVDGVMHPAIRSEAAALKDFEADGSARVIFGNDATGSVGWHGELLGYLITQQRLDDTRLDQLARRFREGRSVSDFDSSEALVAAANFATHSQPPPAIKIPATLSNLRRPVLQSEHTPPLLDAVQNFFGFVPLGFLLALAPGGRRHSGLLVVAAASALCCALSLGIELAQVQFAARFSSLYDWGLNTLGGIAGALLGVALVRRHLQLNLASTSDSTRGISKR
ncbi:MAG: VanZ family protein [Myxococcota bacterium]|nr:VanZ family protein [Myxococcota bacterium]